MRGRVWAISFNTYLDFFNNRHPAALWTAKAQFGTRPNWAFETMVFLAYCCLKDEYTAGGFYEENEWHLVGKLMIKQFPFLP